MDVLMEVERIRAAVLEKVSEAAKARDIESVANLSGVAQQCQMLTADARALESRVSAFKASLNGGPTFETLQSRGQSLGREPRLTRTARGTAAAAREQWVRGLSSNGLSLTGHGKRYQTMTAKAVGVAYANELPGLPNKWFLGLTDEPTDVAVLLCRATSGTLYDLVLPVRELGTSWKALSRSGAQVKFNVRKDANSIVLLVPGGNPLDVTRYVGNYGSLR